MLRITDACVYLDSPGKRTLLFWPADRTMWRGNSRAITFWNFDGRVVSVENGDRVVLGGGGDSRAESGVSGVSGEDWAAGMSWVMPPGALCSLDPRWGVGAVLD
jgi:hypothetical protein